MRLRPELRNPSEALRGRPRHEGIHAHVLEGLRVALGSAPAVPAVPPVGPAEESAVLILHPSAAFSLAVAEDLRTRGLVPEIVPDLPAARDTVHGGRRPTAAVVHLPSDPGTGATDDLLGDLDRLGTAVVGLLPANAGTARVDRSQASRDRRERGHGMVHGTVPRAARR